MVPLLVSGFGFRFFRMSGSFRVSGSRVPGCIVKLGVEFRVEWHWSLQRRELRNCEDLEKSSFNGCKIRDVC